MISMGALIGASAIGAGLSAATQYGTSFLSNYMGRKNERKSLARQYAYARLYALNSPTWNVEGLRNANLNPILAATDGAFSSPTVPNVGYNSPSASSSNGLNLASLMLQNKAAKHTADLQDSTAQLQKSQETLNHVRAINELKNLGFKGNAAVAARLYSELTGANMDTSARQAFANLWNSIQDNNTPLSRHDALTDFVTPSHDVKTRHHPSDTVNDYLSPSDRRSFEDLVSRYGYDGARSIMNGQFNRASSHKRLDDSYRRHGAKILKHSSIITR